MKEKFLLDRELSWIKFNSRVLEEAECLDNPVIERLRFISIFQSNYDEFFRVRVGSAIDQLLVTEDDEEEKKYQKKLERIYKATKNLLPCMDKAFADIMKDSEPYFSRVTEKNITSGEKAYIKRFFEKEIAPFVAPFIIEKKHPFPFVDNFSAITGVTIKKKNGGVKFGFIPMGNSLPKIVFMPKSACRFMLLEDIMHMYASRIFHRFEIIEKATLFIVRNSDIDVNEGLYDYDVDFRETMSKLVDLRQRLAPVEVKYVGDSCEKLITHLSRLLFLSKKQFFRQETPLSMSFLSAVETRLPKSKFPQLYYAPLKPQFPSAIKKDVSIIEQIEKRDILLSYPFEDINVLISLLDEAAQNPQVTKIYISLYRVASNSKIIHSLMSAAKNGKEVICIVELRARFDEANNIDWSKQLEEAGCRIYYGLARYKVHCKLILIEFSGRRRNIAHIGTGNFNESTAKLYTDLALITSNRAIADDVREVFRALIENEFAENTKELMVAPLCLKKPIIELINGEIDKQLNGQPAAITLKINALTDKEIIYKLVEASQAGVKIKMIIRGVCCLIPGVEGYTDNIEIISIVGRFLEHSRIYAFGVGKDCKYYISSADLMSRNTDQRVEVAAPVYDYKSKLRLSKILKLCLSDNIKARKMTKQAKYVFANKDSRANAHNMQIELYKQAYDDTQKYVNK